MSAIIYWQNPCKLPMSFRCIKAYMLAFSGRFSRKCLEGISFKFFVCFIFNVSLGSAPKRKNFDIQRNTRVASGGQFTSNYHTPSHILEHLLKYAWILFFKGKLSWYFHQFWSMLILSCLRKHFDDIWAQREWSLFCNFRRFWIMKIRHCPGLRCRAKRQGWEGIGE